MAGLNALLRSLPAAQPNALLDLDGFTGRVYTPEEIMGWAEWVRRTPHVQTEQGYLTDEDLSRLVPSAGFAEYLRRVGY